MRIMTGTAVLLAVAGLVLAEDKKPETKEEPKEGDGWISLFDGKTLKGWKSHPKSPGKWTVEDGAIVGRGPASHLFTERGDFRNFRVKMEIMINDKGNSGMYFRTQYGPGFPAGWEAQVNATHSDPIRTGSLYPSGREKDLRAIKEIQVFKALHKPEEWFTQEVEAVGPKITIWVNGEKTVEWTDPKDRFKSGHFAIQQHDPGSVVKVRKVEVKILPEDRK
ncbi:MAG: DUF1080 domain-containing protein [Gemmataceae bacterium]